MRSAENKRERASLVGRVALAGALAAALGGASATLAASSSSRHLVERQDRELLSEAAEELASETLEELREDDDDDSYRGVGTLGGALEHELEEVDFPNARAAVFRGESRVGGDDAVPRVEAGACVDYEVDGAPRRACAATKDELLFVLSVDARRQEDQLALFVWSGLLGMLVAALLAALFARRAASWALRPLDALRDRVRAIDPDDPEVGGLSEPIKLAEIDELREATVELIERLAASLASARGFAAEAAHELRTPLTTIVGELEMIAESDAPVEKTTIARLRHRVGSLVALVQRLLVLAQPARIEGESSEAVDLGEVVREVVEAFDDSIRARVVMEIEEDAFVRGDSTLLGALVSNAVENAIKFSSKDIIVRVRAEGEERLIEVVDSGPGIPVSEMQAVFAPFYRMASTRASGATGSGVGLALIAHVAAIHGGTVSFVPASVGAHLKARFPRWKSRG